MTWTLRTSTAVRLVAMVLVLSAACSSETKPYAGALMLSVQTDLSAPKDVSSIGLFITSDGRPVFSDTRDVAPSGEVKLPATLAILGDLDRPRAVIKIRAVAFKSDGSVRVLRDIITTVPKGRTALLRAPLLWVNEGSGSGKRQDVLTASLRPLDNALDTLTRLTSACPDGQTFIDGECGDANVDSSTLPDYDERQVFGGGTAKGAGGTCFDVLSCFAGARAVPLDAATCSASLTGISADDPRLSFAVSLPAAADAGECSGGTCLVPLDKGVGWRPQGANVTFSRSLCAKIASGKALGIMQTTRCPTKDLSIPSCGPASAVSTSAPIADAGGDGAPLNASADFDDPIEYSGEPNVSSVAIDANSVYIARASASAPPSGVVKLPRAEVLAQKTPATVSVLFGYAAAQPSRIVLGPQPSAQWIVTRSEGVPPAFATEIRVCTPTSSNDCPSVVLNGTPLLALGATDVFAYGDNGGEPGIFSINLAAPALNAQVALPFVPVTSMFHQGGTIYLGMVDGSISKCAVPCSSVASLSQVRAATGGPTAITAITADDRVPNKIFFMQIPADGTSALAGIYEIGSSGGGERQLAPGAEILGSPPPLVPPAALAVDSAYVYWGGVFDDPRGGRKYGLVRKSLSGTASEPFVELNQTTEPVDSIAVDGSHVFWSYNRPERAVVFSRKKRSF